MTIQSVERLHYYQQQWLGAEDFQDQQEYHRSMRHRHNLAHHTPGIITGLELTFATEDPADPNPSLTLQPGMAVDGFGREIIVFAPVKVYGAAFNSDVLPNANKVALEGGPIFICIWLAYKEAVQSGPSDAYACRDGTTDYGRTSEDFVLLLEFGNLNIDTDHTWVMVDGVSVNSKVLSSSDPLVKKQPAFDVGVYSDEGVPHQELPGNQDDDNWMIFLGKVKWDGNTFLPASLDTSERTYVSAVAAQILVPNSKLRIRRRTVDPYKAPTGNPLPPPDLTVSLEGALTIERLTSAHDDVQIHGKKLDMRDAGGNNTGPAGKTYPTTLERAGTSGLDLRVTAGEKGDPKKPETLANFVVGYQDNTTFTPTLAVENTGKVSINGPLTVSGDLQAGTLQLNSGTKISELRAGSLQFNLTTAAASTTRTIPLAPSMGGTPNVIVTIRVAAAPSVVMIGTVFNASVNGFSVMIQQRNGASFSGTINVDWIAWV